MGMNKPPLGSVVNWGHPLSNGLVGCWLMNEGAGLKATDIVSKMNGTLAGGSFFGVRKAPGKGLLYPKSDGNRCEIADNTRFTFTTSDSFSFAVYFIPTDVSATFDLIRQDRDTQLPRSIIAMAGSSTGISFFIADAIANISTGKMTQTITAGNLYMAVGVRETATDTVKLYLNGQLGETVATDKCTGTINSDIPLYLGTYRNTGAGSWEEEFAGYIYAVYFWRKALTATEVKELYVNPYCFISPRSMNIGVSTVEEVGSNLSKSLTDAITISDTLNPLIPTLLKQIVDSVTVSDTISPLIPTLLKTLSDNIIASDTLTSVVTDIATLTALLTDNINTTDTLNPLIPQLLQTLVDNITSTDTLNPLIPILFQTLVDNLTVSDLLTISQAVGRTFQVFDSGNGWISFTVKGVEVMRLKENGDIDINGNVNANAF